VKCAIIEILQDPNTWILHSDSIRVPLLLLEVAMVFIGLHLSFKFFKNYATLKETSRGSKMHAAWAWLFIGYAATVTIYIIADFYTDLLYRFDWLEFGYASLSTGALFYIYNIESVGIIKTKHVFSITFGILYIILLVLLVMSVFLRMVSGDFVQLFAIAFLIPMILLFFTYTVKVNKLIQGKMKVYSAVMIAGLAMFITGWIGATDVAVRIIGIGQWMRLIADFLQIGGLCILGLFFSLLPSWREIEWRSSLKSLFVIYQGGTCIFQHDFTGRKEESSASMMMGGVVEMVKSVLDQVLLPGTLKVFDFKDKKMVLEQGKYVSVAVVADHVSDSLDYVLHEFVTQFEAFFGKVLQDWSGDSSLFEPTGILFKGLLG
jgi:hypothetical protein